ncbi:COG3014 family protein [Motilimonas pumila]|uniref:COG3014 family protein n=1 Tax=Motilimonas pumila TaxID=2303987 RepID=UPI0011C35616|nr:hypothetical protein [Motilimonas pumila]
MAVKSVFVGYDQQLQSTRQLAWQGQFDAAAQSIELGPVDSRNHILQLLQQGRALFLAQDFEASLTRFQQAAQVLAQLDRQAQYRLSQGVNLAATTVTNDNLIPYELPDYERTMLHHYLAINYLALSRVEPALVEVRKARQAQLMAAQKRQDELRQAANEAAEQGVIPDVNAAFNGYPDMSGLIGNVKNGYQNAYTFYVSALLYELVDEPNAAYIDYKKALEIAPDNRYIQQRLLVLAKRLGMTQDLAMYQKLFTQFDSHSAQDGRVVILIEQDLVAAKQDMHLPIPIRSSDGYYGVFNVAVPVYNQAPRRAAPLSIYQGNTLVAHSAEITGITNLAAKQLQEDMPAMLVRQAIRVYTKEMVRKNVADSAGDWGNLLVNLYNTLSETADTRSWSLLPGNVQVMDLSLGSGEQSLELRQGASRLPLNIAVAPGQTRLLLVTSMAGKLYLSASN